MSYKLGLFWVCLIALVVILMLNLLKGSKEWFDMSNPNTLLENQSIVDNFKPDREVEILLDSQPDPELVSDSDEVHHLQPKADPRLERLNRPRFDLRTGMPTEQSSAASFAGMDQPNLPKVQMPSSARPPASLVEMSDSSLQHKFGLEGVSRSQPKLDLQTGLPVELPQLTKILPESTSTIPIRHGIRGSDIRKLPPVGGSPIRKTSAKIISKV